MLPLEIKKDVFWVGAVDYNTRDFHGYTKAPEGTTSNAYIIKDEKTVLFDTVKAEFSSHFLCRLAHVVEPGDIDYIVVNHAELDHAGALPQVIERCKPEKVICSVMGERSLKAHFNTDGWPIETVKTGDTINIGKRNINFIETRMVHWPDSMFSYIPEDKLLISNDAFGQNIASSERFADEIDRDDLEHSMRHYYYNIVVPYSTRVLSILEQVGELGIEIDMIAPDHGLIYRTPEDVKFVLDKYKEYATQIPQKRALVVYDTMWNSTEKMAYSICEGLNSVGIPTKALSLKANHHSSIATELSKCGLVAYGSPTHNNTILPTMAAATLYLKGLRFRNKLGFSFGSFGWSGECVNILDQHLKDMQCELPVEAMKVNYVPKHDDAKECFKKGQELGKKLIEFCDNFKA